MNSQGRHYRDPTKPNQPTCNYEIQGTMCDFFQTSEFAGLPYPEDITFGPVAEHTPAPSLSQPTPASFNSQPTELAAILAILNEQKAEAELQKQAQSAQTEQLRILQAQVLGLMNSQAVSTSSPSSTTVTATTTTAPISSVVSPSNSAPRVIADAAAILNTNLQSSVAATGQGYTGLTMETLRSDPHLVSRANTMLANATRNVPPLNPLVGMGEALGHHHGGLQSSQVSTVDQLYRATTINKQLRCHEFAATGQFAYRSQLKLDNCNAVAFAFGAFKHLEAIKSGLICNVSDAEFLARLRHLKNIFEIACLSSSLNSFSDPSWLVAREYDNRIISDIEAGAKSWVSLSIGIEPDAIYCAKETVENRAKAAKKVANPKEAKDKKSSRKVCTTYNSHRGSDGCYFEQQNQGQKCIFEHSCSWCKENRHVVEKHKLFNCEHKTE